MTCVPDRPNNFVRFMIASFALLLMTLVGLTFYKGQPQYTITPSIITILALIVVLVLSETFDNLSIGKILSLSREVTKIATEKDDLKRENVDLRNSLLSVATNVQQTQSSTTIQAMGSDLARALGVEKAPEIDKSEKDEVDEEDEEKTESQGGLDGQLVVSSKAGQKDKVKVEAVNKFISKYQLPIIDLNRNVRLSEAVESLDPVMVHRIIFQGYIKTPHKEYFIYVRRLRKGLSTFQYKLYTILTKILRYREAKKVDAELVLLWVRSETELDGKNNRRENKIHRIWDSLYPAIAKNLLRIETIVFTEEEMTKLSNSED